MKCAFEYPTDWWPMYSWGSQAGRSDKAKYKHPERLAHPYYRYGFENPTDDSWATCHTEQWRKTIREVMTKAGT